MPYVLIMNKYQSLSTFSTYLYLISLSTLCSQSIGHISGILFSSDTKVALVTSFSLHWAMMILGNIIVPINEFPEVIQYLGYTSHIKYTFESIMIMIYGWDKCRTPGMYSSVLNRFSINEDSYWPNVRDLVIVLIALRLTALLALICKSNDWRKMFASKTIDLDKKTDNSLKIEFYENDMNKKQDKLDDDLSIFDLW